MMWLLTKLMDSLRKNKCRCHEPAGPDSTCCFIRSHQRLQECLLVAEPLPLVCPWDTQRLCACQRNCHLWCPKTMSHHLSDHFVNANSSPLSKSFHWDTPSHEDLAFCCAWW